MILPRGELGRVDLPGGGVELTVDGSEGNVSQGQQNLEILHVISEKYYSYQQSSWIELISSYLVAVKTIVC